MNIGHSLVTCRNFLMDTWEIPEVQKTKQQVESEHFTQLKLVEGVNLKPFIQQLCS